MQSVQADAKKLQAAVNAEQADTRRLTIARERLRLSESSYLSVLTAQTVASNESPEKRS
jgi:outer membrane protein TolC